MPDMDRTPDMEEILGLTEILQKWVMEIDSDGKRKA